MYFEDLSYEERKSLIDTNIDICELVLQEVKTSNKGSYAHNLNRDSYNLENNLKELKKKKFKDITMLDITKCTKLSQSMGYCLWLLSKNR